MAKKLKTYETSLGFFDLAIAAPSMKAALEAWGADSNLFHQGAAKQSEDPDVVAATMAKPGVVLKRPVGSNGPFKEHAELPTNLGDAMDEHEACPQAGRPQTEEDILPAVDKAAEQKAAVAYEREQKRRDRERAREEAARQKERERRQQAVDKAQSAFDRPNANMRRGPWPSRPRSTPSKSDRNPRTSVGRWRKRNWKVLCAGRETRAQRVRDRAAALGFP